MHKKSFRLLISTLLLLLTVLIGGCGKSTESTNVEEPRIEDSNINESTIKVSNSGIDSSRFFVESIKISTPEDASYPFFDYSFIITDFETGKQYLYLYHDNGYDGGTAIVELGTTTNVNNDIDE